MQLRDANVLAIKLMREHGLIEKGWRFKFDRGVKRFGICRYGVKVIGLSKRLTELNDEAHVRDTILHEIAHALVGSGHSHDYVWQNKCLEIGGDGRARYDSTSVTAVPQRYRADCGSCGKVVHMTRKPQLRRSCNCGGKRFNPDHVLDFVDTRTGRLVTTPRGWTEWDRTTFTPIPIVDMPTAYAVAASNPAPAKRESLKRVDSHEWQTRDGRLRFVRGWAGTSERTWSVVTTATGAVHEETFPTLTAAKEAIL